MNGKSQWAKVREYWDSVWANKGAKKASVPIRIVPSIHNGDGIHATRGTRVYAGNVEIKGIYRIELSCEVNDVWRATIHAYVQPPDEIIVEGAVVETSLDP